MTKPDMEHFFQTEPGMTIRIEYQMPMSLTEKNIKITYVHDNFFYWPSSYYESISEAIWIWKWATDQNRGPFPEMSLKSISGWLMLDPRRSLCFKAGTHHPVSVELECAGKVEMTVETQDWRASLRLIEEALERN